MKVYIVIQSWKNDYDSESKVIGVFDTKEKASEKIKELYKKDLEWMIKEYHYELDELDENILNDSWSCIRSNDEICYNENEIKVFDVK